MPAASVRLSRRMPGAGVVDFHGPQRPAIRVQVDPDRIAARGLTLADVRTSVATETVNALKGSLKGETRNVVIDTPMLCARFLQESAHDRPNRFQRAVNRFHDGFSALYGRSLDVALCHRVLTLVVALVALGGTVWFYPAIPKGFLPQQDTGFIQATLQGAPDTSFEAMSAKLQDVAERAAADPDIENVGS